MSLTEAPKPSQKIIVGFGEIPEEYKDKLKLSPSRLCCYDESPAHYESKYILEETEKTDAMEEGNIVHMAVLEPEIFEQFYTAEEPPPAGLVKTIEEAKAYLDRMQIPYKASMKRPELLDLIRGSLSAENDPALVIYDDWYAAKYSGKTVITSKLMRACTRIRDRIRRSPTLNFLISDGQAEKFGWAYYTEYDILMRFKMDYFKVLTRPVPQLGGAQAIVTDLKTVPDVRERKFKWKIWDDSMHVQAAIYIDIIQAYTGMKSIFVWALAERSAPFLTRGAFPKDPTIEAGRMRYHKLIRDFKNSVATNTWPQPFEELSETELPDIAYESIEYIEEIQ